MKILIDSYELTNKEYNLMRTLVHNLKNNKKCKVTLLCSNEQMKKNLLNSDDFFDFDIKTFEDNLEEYDFFLSSKNDKPNCITKYSNITSIAILLDLIHRIEFQGEKFTTIRENTRFFRMYDYYISVYDYGNSDYNSVLELDLRKQIVFDLYNLGNNYTEKDELNFRKSVCTNKFSDLIVEKMVEILSKNQNMPLVSIVTITFDLVKNKRDKTIIECLNSVKNQTYKNIEHIIIDGSSTDGTLELIKRYDQENRLKIFSEKDSGIYDAMNKGLKQAKGKYIVYLNSDDSYCRTNAVEEAVILMEKNELDYLFGNAKALTAERKETIWVADINNLPYAMNYCHQTLFVKTEIMRNLGGFDLNYKISADSDIMIKLYKKNYKYGILREPYIIYRLGGLSSEQSEQSKRDHSESFYNNIGKNIGLTKKECEEIWAMRFIQFYPIRHQLYMLRKLSKFFDTDEMVLRLMGNYNSELSLKQSIKRIGQIVYWKLKNIVKARKLG